MSFLFSYMYIFTLTCADIHADDLDTLHTTFASACKRNLIVVSVQEDQTMQYKFFGQQEEEKANEDVAEENDDVAEANDKSTEDDVLLPQPFPDSPSPSPDSSSSSGAAAATASTGSGSSMASSSVSSTCAVFASGSGSDSGGSGSSRRSKRRRTSLYAPQLTEDEQLIQVMCEQTRGTRKRTCTHENVHVLTYTYMY